MSLTCSFHNKNLGKKQELHMNFTSHFAGKLELNPESEFSHENEREDLELPLFDFIAIAKATNSFSINNKLGEGGFGSVYKVKLSS